MRISIAFLLLVTLSNLIYAQVDGLYESTCLPMGSGHEESFRATLSIAGNKTRGDLRFYSDKTCGFEAFKLIYLGEANYPEGVLTGPFDQKILSGTFILTDPQFLKNKGENCSNVRFVIGKENDLKALGNCAPLSFPTTGKILFDIFALKGDQITFGGFPLIWITDEEKRPALMGGVGLKRNP